MMPITESVKIELQELIERYPQETAIDHLKAFLRDIRDELMPFCREIDLQRDSDLNTMDELKDMGDGGLGSGKWLLEDDAGRF